MANFRRPRVRGATIFFTVALADRQSALLVEEIDRLRFAVAQTLRDRPVEVRAWIVLPDHMHAIWNMPPGDADFSTRWRIIKSRFSRGLPVQHRRASHLARNERGIWQRRFWEHHIRDQADLDGHLRYCWWNPVKHGLVERPEDWAFSSFAKRGQLAA